MKNLTRILLFFSLLLIGGGVWGQTKIINFSDYKPPSRVTFYDHSIIRVSDSVKGIVAIMDSSDNLAVTDSLATITILLKTIRYMQSYERQLIEKFKKPKTDSITFYKNPTQNEKVINFPSYHRQ